MRPSTVLVLATLWLGLATTQTSAAPQLVDTTFSDPSRNRSLPLRVRLPAGTGAAPVVVFSHGLGGSRDGGQVWGEHWAANGYLVVHTQHPGSDAQLLKSGFGAPLQRLKRGATGEQLIARAADVSFVLDEIKRRQASGDPLFARADLSRVAMTGHSFGAMTTLALAGQRYPATTQTLVDVRFKAFIAFSPQIVQGGARAAVGAGGGTGAAFDAYRDIKNPMLVVTGSIDGDMLGNGASADRRAAVFDALPPGHKYRVVFDDGDHMVFNGGALEESATFLKFIDNRTPQTSPATAAGIHAKTQTLSLKFLDAYLKGEAGAKDWLATEAAQALGSTGVWSAK